MTYFTRAMETFFLSASQQFPVMLATGARQVGKTTFLRHLSTSERTYVTLDDPLVLELAKNDPALFFQRYHGPLLIDEIQYAPELLPYIKIQVDQYRHSGMFWLTGSQQFHLMRGVSESLAGRVGIVNILGLTHREHRRTQPQPSPFLPTEDQISKRLLGMPPLNIREVFRIIWRGAFPAIVINDTLDHNLFYSSYVQTYLQRDLRDLSKVGDEMSFLRFLRASAARTAQLLNIRDLARDADIAPNTAKIWLSILTASGIVYLLEPYHSNITKRLVKTPKLYFLDTGLCAWLTGWSSPETLEAGAASGAFLENWIFLEIMKSWLNHGRQPPFFFYRDDDQKEIHLLIYQDGTLYPLEFKKTASPNKDAVRQFKTLQKLKLPIGKGGLICFTQNLLPLSSDILAIPMAAL